MEGMDRVMDPLLGIVFAVFAFTAVMGWLGNRR